jgi:hypothetical protein
MIRATAIATDAEPPLLPAAIRFLPRPKIVSCFAALQRFSLSSHQLFFPFVDPHQLPAISASSYFCFQLFLLPAISA